MESGIIYQTIPWEGVYRGNSNSQKELLRAKLGIKVNLNRDKDRFRLRVQSGSMEKLIRMITPYIIPSMLYKLPL